LGTNVPKKTKKGIAKSSEDTKQRKLAKASDKQVVKAKVSYFPTNRVFFITFCRHRVKKRGVRRKNALLRISTSRQVKLSMLQSNRN